MREAIQFFTDYDNYRSPCAGVALYGVKALDAVSYLLAMMGVAVVALAASAAPAVRAASVSFDRPTHRIIPLIRTSLQTGFQ